MKKLFLTTLLSLAWLVCAAQDPLPTVSVSAKGDDVRMVLHSLFEQSKKSFILEPNVRFVLFLSLKEVDFDEALELICKTAGLKYELQNGIYFVTRAPAKAAPAKQEPKPEIKPDPKPEKAEVKRAPSKTLPKAEQNGESKILSTGNPPTPRAEPTTLPKSVLSKKVTTRLAKVDIRVLFADLSRQTGVPIELDKSVPAYRFDAYLDNATLGYALENIAKAAGLEIQFTNRKSISLVPAKGAGKSAGQ